MSDSRPSVQTLASFLKHDSVAVRTLQAAADTAGVDRASDDLLIVEEEEVARLFHLGLDSFPKLQEAMDQAAPVVVRLVAAWRRGRDDAITPQELFWALTYVVAADGDEPFDHIRALVSGERWWQRATASHRDRFLERIVSEVAAAKADEPGPNPSDHPKSSTECPGGEE